MTDPQRAAELAFGYCLRRLTAAARSEHDLSTKLRERGYEDDVIDVVLVRLRRAGYVDDAAFARSWVRSRSMSKSLTAAVLRQELRRKGIADDLIDDAVRSLRTDEEDDRARELLRRKAPASIPEDRGERDRLARRLGGVLARRGYSSARAWYLVNELLAERAEPSGCR